MLRVCAFCLFSLILGALCAIPSAPPGMTLEILDEVLESSEQARPARAAAGQAWLRLLEEYARTQMKSSGPRVLRAFRLELPLSDGEESVSLLVLPIPISEESCSIGLDERISDVDKIRRVNQKETAPGLGINIEDDENDYVSAFRPRPFQPPPPFEANNDFSDYMPPPAKRPPPPPPPPLPRPYDPIYDNKLNYPFVPDSTNALFSPSSNQKVYGPPKPFRSFDDDSNDFVPSINAAGHGISINSYQSGYIVPGNHLVEQFKLQRASGIELPPALIYPVEGAALTLEHSPPAPGPSPPPLRWERSLLVSGELTIPRAGYTEKYGVSWDAATGASRVIMHGGTASSHVEPQADGTYRLSSRVEDRSGGSLVRRCYTSEPLNLSPRDRSAIPTLPDPEPFHFQGYSEVSGVQAEVWKHEVQELARGDTLTYHHELIVRRSSYGEPLPLSYTVSVDSSILGPYCDSWQHRYTDVREQQHLVSDLGLNADVSCDGVETLDMSDEEHRARLQPLREFTLPTQDPRYKIALQKFMSEFQRVYVDEKEESVRKNLFIQHSRFVSSCNRQGGPFETTVNFLGDRLDAELDVLLGVVEGADGIPAEAFPHSESDLDGLSGLLPEEFDWRNDGAVSHVRYQGSCSSCWAIAVSGAVEGALWRRTRRLVPLAEQCLVDCAHQYGANGCSGTWPSHAYDYVQNKGLPALDEYGPHKEKVETCRDKQVPPVTHISAHVNVTGNSWSALKVSIKEHSPTVVIIDAKAKSFIFYKKGVLYDDRCGKQRPRLNHAVLAVGYGPEYATLKNSWSAAWGEEGYVRVQAPANTCGVLAQPSYPRLEDKDVDRR